MIVNSMKYNFEKKKDWVRLGCKVFCDGSFLSAAYSKYQRRMIC